MEQLLHCKYAKVMCKHEQDLHLGIVKILSVLSKPIGKKSSLIHQVEQVFDGGTPSKSCCIFPDSVEENTCIAPMNHP